MGTARSVRNAIEISGLFAQPGIGRLKREEALQGAPRRSAEGSHSATRGCPASHEVGMAGYGWLLSLDPPSWAHTFDRGGWARWPGPHRTPIDQFSMLPRQPPLSWPVDSIIVLNDSRSALTMRSSDPIMLPTDSLMPSGS